MSLYVVQSDLKQMVKSPLWELNDFTTTPLIQVYTSLTAVGNAYGWLNFNVPPTNDSGLDGNRYRTMNAINNTVEVFGMGIVQVKGSITIDKDNGSVVSHTIDQPPAGISLFTPGGAYDPGPPTSTSTDGLQALWQFNGATDMEMDLSNPWGIDDMFVTAQGLLDSQDITLLKPGESWDIRYESANGIPIDTTYLVPTWIYDPVDHVTPIAAWVNPASGQMILDRDMPGPVTPKIVLTDTGAYTPTGSPGTPQGPFAFSRFTQGTIGNGAAFSKLMVRNLVQNSKHCAADVPDANAATAGNPQSAFEIDADASGNLIMDHPGMVISASLQEEEVDRYLYLNNHPSGIVCVPN